MECCIIIVCSWTEYIADINAQYHRLSRFSSAAGKKYRKKGEINDR